MCSSEPLICEECGQIFDTIESLREHQETEREEKELRNKGIDDWILLKTEDWTILSIGCF